ncbi:MAG TPA: hypothetical protein VLC93_14230, partial [Myxococcota bacterium]|nr:hypothetical protein [Myxococcota bacterium]
MLAGVTGARASAVQSDRRVIDIRSSQVSEMEGEADKYRLEFGPTIRGRMSLEQAFAAMRAGQIDLNDDESPIRFPRPTELGYMMDRAPGVWGHTLLALDDGINDPVIVDLGAPGQAPHSHQIEEEEYERHSGHQAHGEDLMVDMPAPRPPRVTIREVEPGEGYDDQHGAYEPEPMPRFRDEPMDEPGPMPRGGHPTYDRVEPQMGFDRAPQAQEAEDAPRVRKVDPRGGGQAPAAQKAGEDGFKV